MILQQVKLLQEDGQFQVQDLQFQETFQALGQDLAPSPGEESLSCEGMYLVPGLIDIHTHGAMGKDASDGNPQDMDILSAYYAKQGVTSWCPTTMTLPEAQLHKAVTTISAYQNPVGAKVLGIYLEGPFFHSKKKGAQAEENLALPEIGMFQRLQEASGNTIAVLALAPELEGSMDLIAHASRECTVTLAHSTADFDCATEAFRQGASLTTHLFNAMMPLHHREPGIVGAAFQEQAFAEIICDGLHIHPSVMNMAFQLFGERLCLISDSLRCAGMPDGQYTLGGQPIVKKNQVATLLDGTLAGSSVGLLEGVRNVISQGISPNRAFFAASTAPARALGKEAKLGSIAPGKYADFLLLNQDFQLIATYVNGKKVYQGEHSQ